MRPAIAHPLAPGARVRIERDETRWPSRGSWPRFRGRVGTIIEVNEDRCRPERTEYGVAFGGVSRHSRTGNLQGAGGCRPAWFLAHELAPAGEPLSGPVGDEHGRAA